MNPQQLRQLRKGMGDILGRRIPGTFRNMEDFLGDRSGLNLGDKAAEAFSSRMTPQEFQELNNRRLAEGRPWSEIKDLFQTTQAFKAPQIHQLLANMGFTGPGSGMTNMTQPQPLPGPPQSIGQDVMWQPSMPDVMWQPSMPGGMQPPVRVNDPRTFFGGQQPQQPMLNPGPIQGTMGMTPPMNFTPPAGSPAATGQPFTLNQPPAASLPAFNNPQYGGMGIR